MKTKLFLSILLILNTIGGKSYCLNILSDRFAKDSTASAVIKNNNITASFTGQNFLNENTIKEKHWKLIELNGQKISSDSVHGQEPYINFSGKDNSFTGNGGCNSFGGEYDLMEGNRIKFSKIISTMMMCQDMTTEDQFMRVLEETRRYTLIGDTLYLNNEDMTKLAKFESVSMDSQKI